MKKTAIVLGTVCLYANPNTKTIKRGSKGRAVPAGEFFGGMTKSEARRLRKELHRAGFTTVAGTPRQALLGVPAHNQ